MNNEEERFDRHPSIAHEKAVSARIEDLSNRMHAMEGKMDKISRMLNEILKKNESHEILMPKMQKKNYGFEPEDEVD